MPQDFRRLLLALVGMPSASEAYIHLSSLPRRDQKSLLIKEISNKNYMPDSHMFTQVSPHFFSDKQDMARHRDSSAYCNSLQQKLWGLKTPSVPCAQFSAADCLRAQGVKKESPGPWEASHFQVLHQNSEDCFPTGWALWKEWYSRVLTSPQHCFPLLRTKQLRPQWLIYQLHLKSSTRRTNTRRFPLLHYYVVYAWIIEKNRVLD